MITEPRVQMLMTGGYIVAQVFIEPIHKIVTILAVYSPAFKKKVEAEQWLIDNTGENS